MPRLTHHTWLLYGKEGHAPSGRHFEGLETAIPEWQGDYWIRELHDFEDLEKVNAGTDG